MILLEIKVKVIVLGFFMFFCFLYMNYKLDVKLYRESEDVICMFNFSFVIRG